MVPEEYRTINRAICLLGDEHQDEREGARHALHKLFRQQVRLEKDLAAKDAYIDGWNYMRDVS